MTFDRPVISVAAVDDHPIVLRGIRAVFEESEPDLVLLAIAPSVADLLAGVGRGADVVLLDLHIPAGPPVEESVAALVRCGSRVLVHTSEQRPVPVRRAIEAGAVGLVLKSDDVHTIAQAIRDAVAGELACSGELAHVLATDPTIATRLAPQQVAVIRLAAEGHTYDGIGRALGISPHTVRTHLARACRSYAERGQHVGNTHQLVHTAIAEGHLDPPGATHR